MSVVDKIEFWKKFGKSYRYFDANTTSPWLPMDTKELFEKNKNDPLMLENGWNEHSIVYRTNNFGFRSNIDYSCYSPNKPDNINVFLGCSLTEGIGLNLEDTWAYKINQQLNGTFYNLGQGGGGLETQYRLLKAWAPVIQPKKVFSLGSFEPRRELFAHQSEIRTMFTPHVNSTSEVFAKFFSSENESLISSTRTVDAMITVCRQVKAEFYMPTSSLLEFFVKHKHRNDWGRDLRHPGKKFHDSVVDSFNQFNEWQQLC